MRRRLTPVLHILALTLFLAFPLESTGQQASSPPSMKGVWRTYDVTDGLVSGFIPCIYQDRDGVLWLCSRASGVIRYDGQTFTTLDTEDGLADNRVRSIFQDREGRFWFGTFSGVSRYDPSLRTQGPGSGQVAWTTFTTEDGLAHDRSARILQDREGHFWFGTSAGVSRYDGDSWTTLTTEDGLANDSVGSILQDREGNLWFGTNDGVSRYDPGSGPGKSWVTFTTKDGLAHNDVSSIFQDQEGAFWFGTWGGVSRYDPGSEAPSTELRAGGTGPGSSPGQAWTTFTTEDGLAHNHVTSLLQDREGHPWFGTSGGVSRYDPGSSPGQAAWTTFTTEDGLPDDTVISLLQDREGDLWVGTYTGLSRYGGRTWITFTTEDGLVNDRVESVHQDRDGHLWFGTPGGVSRFDSGSSPLRRGSGQAGQSWTTFTAEDGLVGQRVSSILQDRDGVFWFGTQRGGVSHYDGKTWTTFTTKDGLGNDDVHAIFQDRVGHIWFATDGGASRFDGQTWATFTTDDGLADNAVRSSIIQDRDGHLWFGTKRGASRYDPSSECKGWETFTIEDGLAQDEVLAMLEGPEGEIWFGTFGGGVSRFDPGSSPEQAWTTFTTKDGLASNEVTHILKDRNGHLWFGTSGGGLSRFDGDVFQTLTSDDGLAGNYVSGGGILESRDGDIWIGTNKGVTRFRSPAPLRPPIVIDAVVADHRYEREDELSIPSTVGVVGFEFHGMSFKTRPDAMVYRHRLKGYDDDWKTTRDRRWEVQDLPVGSYTFEVQAVDRDMVYSETPATVLLHVHLPYERIGWISALSLFIALTIWQTVRVIRRDRRLIAEAEDELQTAHDLQKSLMARESLRIKGFDIAGRCVPANHVGGDFFQYFALSKSRVAGVMADVTGHAMEAAVPMLMFSGMLDTHMRMGGTLEEVFDRLNRALCRMLPKETFICLEIGELNLSTGDVRLTNGGCPYPTHFSASSGELREIVMDAYPLGVRPDTEFPVVEAKLQDGDRLVFYSDGIPEAENGAGDQFGFEATMETIRSACKEDLSASETIDFIMKRMDAFRGAAPQADDITCVVVRMDKTKRRRS